MADPNPSFAGPGDFNPDSNPAVNISTQVMVAAVIVLFAVIVFVFFLYLYARRFFNPDPALSGHRRRRHIVFAGDLSVRRGLAADVRRSLPVTVYNASGNKLADGDRLECAVCLSDVADGETVRQLPSCSHGFHLECIDMWLHSNSTCPLCRTAVAGEATGRSDPSENSESPEAIFPTNVLFWGTQDSVDSRESSSPAPASLPAVIAGDGAVLLSRRGSDLVIEIPSRGSANGFVSRNSPLPSSGRTADEMKSPVSARFRSLRRLWSGGRRSPRDGSDVEQGFGGFVGGVGESSSSRTPRTPRTPGAKTNS